MPITLIDRPELSVGASRLCAVDFQDDLDTGELLTGTPTVAEVTSSDLTITNVGRNTAQMTVKGRTVAIDQAVICLVAGQLVDTEYRLRVTVSTDATPAQTFVYDVVFDTV